MRHTAAVLVLLAASLPAWAGDGLEATLSAQKGKRVTVTLQSGQELTGTVQAIDGDTVRLGELSGKEFFDAVVRIGSIDAVTLRVK